MGLLTFISRILLLSLGFIIALVAAVFVVGIGSVVFLFSILTGRKPKFQVYTNRQPPDTFGQPADTFERKPMRDVTPTALNESL